jgi:prenyltransferase beta subunit
MTIGQETRQAARRARHLLADRAPQAAAFLIGRLHPDGGFRGRGDAADLYYTLFGVEALRALDAELPAEKLTSYLRSFGPGDDLDLIHLACLVRCWIALDAPPRDEWVACLNAFRSVDGGFATEKGAEFGSAYGAFLAIGALQDLGADVPDGVVDAMLALRTPDGGWANDRVIPVGSVPATAATVTVLRHLGHAAQPETGDWLLGCIGDERGFPAISGAPADLLSTAVALHALDGLGVDLGQRRDACLAFVESLWDPRGAFRGNSDDDMLDCEYTWYGLLAIGHLSEDT